jgi:hypothetical protein
MILDFLNDITLNIINYESLFRMIRWMIIFLIVLSWRYVIRKLGNKYLLSEEKIVYWQSKAIHIGIWLIIFELLICENILFKVIQLLLG